MKKIKHFILFILIFSIVAVGIPFRNLSAKVQETNPVKYSDILYAYSDYLSDSQYLRTYVQETQGIFDRVYTEYLDSSDFIAMSFKESLQKSVDLVDWIKTMGSALGLNNYVYENALVSANEMLVNNILSATQSTMVETMGVSGEWAEKISGLCELYEIYDEWASSSNATDTEKINESLNVLYESGILKNVSQYNIETLQKFIEENATASKLVASIGDVLKAGKALMVALVMEDMRAYTVDCIVKHSPKGALYDGMKMLEWQLSNGFVSYFTANFLEGELLSKIADDVVEKVLGYAMGSATPFAVVKLIIETSTFVIFDCIFNTDSLDDLTTQRIITEYAYDCSNVILSAKDIFSEQFTVKDVEEYQNLYAVLRALTDASFEASEVISLPENSVTLRYYKDKYKNDNIFEKTINEVKEIVNEIPVSERERTYYEEWKINKDVTTATISSDKLSDSEMYFPEGKFCGKIFEFNGRLIVPKDISIVIDGDLQFWKSANNYFDGDYDLLNNGVLEVKGTVCQSTFGRERIINNGTLRLHKKVWCAIESYGDIYFCGTEQQIICTKEFIAKNVYVENEKGLKYYSSPKIYGKFVLNNNPIENNGYSTYIYNGFCSDGVSDYKEITISEDFELTFDITADFTVQALKKLIIPENASAKIDGEVHLYGSTTDYNTSIVNYGNAEITGNINRTFGCSIVNEGILKMGGKNVTGYISGSGTLVFNGTNYQEVYVPYDPYLIYDLGKVVLENKSNQGVHFWYHINFTDLFDHNGNNYELYEYGKKTTFIDYDGDDMLDNVDPNPAEFDEAYFYCSKHGDVNTDNKTNILDLIRLKKAVSKEVKDDIYNINKDDNIDSLDMLLIRKYLLFDYEKWLKK